MDVYPGNWILTMIFLWIITIPLIIGIDYLLGLAQKTLTRRVRDEPVEADEPVDPDQTQYIPKVEQDFRAFHKGRSPFDQYARYQ